MDGDGYLDMHIVYPEHYIVEESDAGDQFSYQSYYYRVPPQYWVWDGRENRFVCMNQWELADYIRQEGMAGQPEETTGKVICITVQKGDSFWNIAQKYLGDGAKYTDLYDRNRAVIGKNPDRIMPGMELEVVNPE